MAANEARRKIIVHGLVNHYGTARAKLCVDVLYKYFPKLYNEPKIYTYFENEWDDFVKNVRREVGEIHRKLWDLKYPVVVFFNDKYVGDHRTIIQYAKNEHGIIADMPRAELFLDFTKFIPKGNKKDYVYLDLLVGVENQYIKGKLVFELHTHIVPETCKFFKYLCEPFGEYQFSEAERKQKFSYIGSTIRRICGKSFVQGGEIPNGKFLKIPDENFTVKHNRRGLISIANQGRNRSSTEFVISLKPNPWMDGINVAFGQLIFGDAILRIIEEMPTYYQSPLQDIVIVGCGTIPNYENENYLDFECLIEEERKNMLSQIQENKNKKLQRMCEFQNKIQDFLKKSNLERRLEFKYTEDESEINIKPDSLFCGGEEEFEEELESDIKEFVPNEKIEKLKKDILKESNSFEEVLGKRIYKNLSPQGIINKLYVKYTAQKRKFMNDLICSILEKAMVSDDTLSIIDTHTEDVCDDRDAVTEDLTQEKFEKGLYSLHEALGKSLIEVFEKLTPSQLKYLGLENRQYLRAAEISEQSLNLYGCEDVISGVLRAASNIEFARQELLESSKSSISTKELNREDMFNYVTEIMSDMSDMIREAQIE